MECSEDMPSGILNRDDGIIVGTSVSVSVSVPLALALTLVLARFGLSPDLRIVSLRPVRCSVLRLFFVGRRPDLGLRVVSRVLGMAAML